MVVLTDFSFIIYQNKIKFNELNFKCIDDQIKLVVIYPRKAILLDSQLKQFNMRNPILNSSTRTVFINIKGIDILISH